jgi:hypothetical protein
VSSQPAKRTDSCQCSQRAWLLLRRERVDPELRLRSHQAHLPQAHRAMRLDARGAVRIELPVHPGVHVCADVRCPGEDGSGCGPSSGRTRVAREDAARMWDDPRSTQSDPDSSYPSGRLSAQRRRVLRPRATRQDEAAMPHDPSFPAGAPRLPFSLRRGPPDAEDRYEVRASAHRRALRSRLSARLPLRDDGAGHWDEYAQSGDSWTTGPSARAPGTSGSRARERTAARPITAQ